MKRPSLYPGKIPEYRFPAGTSNIIARSMNLAGFTADRARRCEYGVKRGAPDA
jgi:hypothetical protein